MKVAPILADLPVREGPDALHSTSPDSQGAGSTSVSPTIRQEPDPASRWPSSAPTGDRGTLLREEALGGGLFAWTGRVPPARWSGVADRHAPRHPAAGLRSVGVRPLGRPRLLWRALVREPGLTLSALSWRLQGKKVRARGFLDRALRNRRESGYAHWIRGQPETGAPSGPPSPPRSPAGANPPTSPC